MVLWWGVIGGYKTHRTTSAGLTIISEKAERMAHALIVWLPLARQFQFILIPVTTATFDCDTQGGTSVAFTLHDRT